ncbi:MAG: hypothetical protein LAO20_00440 [Acidobacteriia bacterium]|nr:hypothetical protein [Terriglobia bacterium]
MTAETLEETLSWFHCPGHVVETHKLEFDRHSFIIKIWFETGELGRPKWRGHITHVEDGKRRYVEHLKDISSFIGSYLSDLEAHAEARGRMRRWLDQWTHRGKQGKRGKS